VRERAPKLALLQAFTFTCIILVPYITEIIIDISPDIWCTDDPYDIPPGRKLLKALYSNFRIMSYVVFLFRVLVVYKSWKIGHKKGTRLQFFSNENKVLIVRNPFFNSFR
jgi:hypothetical protein